MTWIKIMTVDGNEELVHTDLIRSIKRSYDSKRDVQLSIIYFADGSQLTARQPLQNLEALLKEE